VEEITQVMVATITWPGGSRIPDPDHDLDGLAVAPDLNLGYSPTLTS
jgi:hypothetical protein